MKQPLTKEQKEERIPDLIPDIQHWIALATDIQHAPRRGNSSELLLDIWLTVKICSFITGYGQSFDLYEIFHNKPVKLFLSGETRYQTGRAWQSNYKAANKLFQDTLLYQVVNNAFRMERTGRAMYRKNYVNDMDSNTGKKVRKMLKIIHQ